MLVKIYKYIIDISINYEALLFSFIEKFRYLIKLRNIYNSKLTI